MAALPGTRCSGQTGKCPVGLSGEGAELPWIGITAEAKQAAGLGVVPSINCWLQEQKNMVAENMGFK